jgi:hypothetical protein
MESVLVKPMLINTGGTVEASTSYVNEHGAGSFGM